MPSKYKDYLLSIEHFVCEQKSGDDWIYADMYQIGQQYRFNISIKNLSEKGYPGYGNRYNKKGVYITEIKMLVEIDGAKFPNGNKNSNNLKITRPGDFADNIAPQESRLFYAEFSWLPAVPIPVKAVPTYVKTQHREVMVMTPGPKTKIDID